MSLPIAKFTQALINLHCLRRSTILADFNVVFIQMFKMLCEFTSGGRILQMPVFSAMGRILLINPKGSEKSSQLGSKTGHSGGGTNSANADMSVWCQRNKSLKMMFD